MAFREVPWKRNYRKVPDSVQETAAAIQSEMVVVAATKKVSLREIASGLYDHVGLRSDNGTVICDGPVLPPYDAGKWSERNALGWDRKRTDLPMITKTYTFESPNFGDAARYGTHMHVQEREVYQHQIFEPQGMRIEAEVLEARGSEHVIVKFGISPLLSKGQPEFDLMLLWSLNVLQENAGAIGVFASEATREEFIGTIQLDWEVFPPGTIDEVVERLAQRPARPSNAPDFDRHVRDRVALFQRLNPTAYLRGQGGFGSYFGAQFAEDLVVFENLKYGNAIYVLYENWDTISQRSRLDLLRDQDASFDRVIHTDGWQEKLKALLRYQLKKRRPRDGRDLFRRRQGG